MAYTRYYADIDGRRQRVPSVTSIMSKGLAWNKDGLLWWANQAGLEGLTLDDARKKATDVGSIVHSMLEADVRGLPQPDLGALPEDMRTQCNTSFEAWTRWKDRYQFTVIAAEHSLVSNEWGFGGTFDLAFMDKRRSLLDFKTSKAYYPDMAVQIAAYGRLWDEHNPCLILVKPL